MHKDIKDNGILWSSAMRMSNDNVSVNREEAILDESAVSLVLNGNPYAVMMLTYGSIEDFFIGFLYNEGIIQSIADVIAWDSFSVPEGTTLYLQITAEAEARSIKKQRIVIGGSSCGLCGKPNFDGLIPLSYVNQEYEVDVAMVQKSLQDMCSQQHLNQLTGTAHAAILTSIGRKALVREDIGRHNAVDKVIGAALRKGLPPAESVMLGVSSRLTFEIVLKALNYQIPVVAAISGVSSMAIDVAQRYGMTLIGFARDCRMTIYAHGNVIEQ